MPSASSSPASSRVPGVLQRLGAWLPTRVDRRVRVFAWLSFIAEVLIIGTGGAVRLTGSGLGCPTWPRCTPDSLVNTPEMGIHGIIEFGNRTLTGLVGILALAVVVLVWRMRHERRVLFVLSLVVLGGIVAQAVVGGITVLTGLNPFIVGFHYVASVVLVAVCAAFLVRMYQPAGPRALAVPRWFAGLVHATTGVLALTIVFGVLTTGAGPHSGDEASVRNGFDAQVLEHVHAWPGYALFALTLVVVAAAWRLRLPVRRWATALLAVELVQIAVGLYQARNGLPEIAVGTHMVLAALAAATMTVVVLRLKTPVAAAHSHHRRATADARA
ncbi:cytochrome c oxidase assembly protein subunit 15 [Microbacterium sp. ru370.1]|uniref:COX15/CtaA family protein n=1 Tax=unclassified Microbacterium TaxID=2609290 RepID=UPI00088E0449|nr:MULTISPECIES: COX15/CtaA family protein [unclassified Microbacterium]SDO73033.1 cytochrome c oxidase assembly protein subunit 15 [Microbacterium sp. ru370.1]SIT87733.1 cytochrome c oxidase assembly protein subunit 15 [Microbacterium sp. RU1D]